MNICPKISFFKSFHLLARVWRGARHADPDHWLFQLRVTTLEGATPLSALSASALSHRLPPNCPHSPFHPPSPPPGGMESGGTSLCTLIPLPPPWWSCPNVQSKAMVTFPRPQHGSINFPKRSTVLRAWCSIPTTIQGQKDHSVWHFETPQQSVLGEEQGRTGQAPRALESS